MTSAALAKTLRIDETRAEFLLAEVSVQDFVSSARAELPAKVRVTELAEPEALGTEAERSHAGSTGKPQFPND